MEISTGIDYDIGILQFADDIALYAKDKSLEDCKIKMEVAIHKIDKNLIKLGLEIESTKTNIMVFNNKKDRENRIVCRIKGKRIGNVRAAKFLGIKMDTKLKFNLHLINRKKSV